MKTEADVKKKLKDALKTLSQCWFFMPVSLGMGVHGVPDFIGCCAGRFFAVETKRPGRRGEKDHGLSGLQVRVKKLIEAAGGLYFVVDDEPTVQDVVSVLRGLYA